MSNITILNVIWPNLSSDFASFDSLINTFFFSFGIKLLPKIANFQVRPFETNLHHQKAYNVFFRHF